jgi:hypothetical protein
MRIALILRAVPAMMLSAVVSAQSVRAPASDNITAAKMRADLEFLAGDGFRGRLTNTPENALALEWMKSRFQYFGLEPMGTNGSYFQQYDLFIGAIAPGNDLAVTRGGSAYPPPGFTRIASAPAVPPLATWCSPTSELPPPTSATTTCRATYVARSSSCWITNRVKGTQIAHSTVW